MNLIVENWKIKNRLKKNKMSEKTNKRIQPVIVEQSQLKPSKFSLMEEDEMNEEPFNISSPKFKELLNPASFQRHESKVTNSHKSIDQSVPNFVTGRTIIQKKMPLDSMIIQPPVQQQEVKMISVQPQSSMKPGIQIQKTPIKTRLIYGIVTSQNKNEGRIYTYLKNLETNDMVPYSFSWEPFAIDKIAHLYYGEVTGEYNKNKGRKFKVYRLNDNHDIFVRGTWQWLDGDGEMSLLTNDDGCNNIAHEEV